MVNVVSTADFQAKIILFLKGKAFFGYNAAKTGCPDHI